VTTVSVAALAIAAAYALTYVSINRALGAQGTAALRNVFSGVLYGEHREVFVYLAVDMVAAAVLVHVLLARRGTGMLSRPALVWVGRISYGGYLFHALVLWIAGRASFETPINELPLPERVTVFVMLWGVTVALASASFVWFEKPLARYLCRKRVMRSRQVSESDATFRTNEPVSAFQNAAPGG
jgi:peptidoglycan/LPS O-acetylase OafA/YrhL